MISNSMQLSGAQIHALAELAPKENPNRTVLIEQTETDSGGRHLYARVRGKYVHISAKGKVTELEP